MLFEGRYTRLFSISSLLLLIGAYCCLLSKDSLNTHYLYSKDGFTYGKSIQYKMLIVRLHVYRSINPLPHMAILGSTNSAANRDMISKI